MKCKNLEELKEILKQKQDPRTSIVKNMGYEYGNFKFRLLHVWYNPKLSVKEIGEIVHEGLWYGDKAITGEPTVTLLFPRHGDFTCDVKSTEALNDIILDSDNWEEKIFEDDGWMHHAPKLSGDEIKDLKAYTEYVVYLREKGAIKEVEKPDEKPDEKPKKLTGPVQTLKKLCEELAKRDEVKSGSGSFYFYNVDIIKPRAEETLYHSYNKWYKFSINGKNIYLLLPTAYYLITPNPMKANLKKQILTVDESWKLFDESGRPYLRGGEVTDEKGKESENLEDYFRYLVSKNKQQYK